MVITQCPCTVGDVVGDGVGERVGADVGDGVSLQYFSAILFDGWLRLKQPTTFFHVPMGLGPAVGILVGEVPFDEIQVGAAVYDGDDELLHRFFRRPADVSFRVPLCKVSIGYGVGANVGTDEQSVAFAEVKDVKSTGLVKCANAFTSQSV